jgi:hypothetical protein
MSELVTLNDSANFAAMAAAMGMNADVKKDSKKSVLPRLKIDHSGVMGEEEIKGKIKKVQVIDAGTYCLSTPTGDGDKKVYCQAPLIRLFNQRFMYKRFIKEGDTGRFVKTQMATDLKVDLRDTDGGFNCGKPGGWVEDYKALPEDMKNLIKSIKRVRVLFGTVTMPNAQNEDGSEADPVVDVPFIWEVDNKTSFKDMGAPIAQLAKNNRLLPQHNILLSTKENALPNGSAFWTAVPALDLSVTLPLTDKDQETFASFNQWIKDYNEYVANAHKEAQNLTEDDAVKDIIDEFVDVEVQEAA